MEVKEQIIYCSSDDVKKLIKDTVNDKLLLNNIIQQLSLSDLVRQELNSKLPNQEKAIKDKVKVLVNEIVSKKLEDFRRDQIPLCVAKEITKEITNFLSNNIQILQITEYHTKQLDLKLSQTANDILNRLVNEPQYQMVTNAHLDSITLKCDNELLKVQSDCNKQLSDNYLKFNNQLSDLKRVNDKELSDLKDGLKQLNELSNYRISTSQTIKTLQNKINTLEWCVSCLSGILVVGSLYFSLKK